MDNKIEPKNADKNPSTSNPPTNADDNQNNSALIIKVNSPNVNIFIGRVINISIGRINKLIKPITTATINAVVKPLILIPGTTFATNNKANDKSNHLIITYIFLHPYLSNSFTTIIIFNI